MSSASRRPRRAVRQSGTVGTDDSVLLATLPAFPPAPAGGAVVGPGARDATVRPVSGEAADGPGLGAVTEGAVPGAATERPGPGGVPDVSTASGRLGDVDDLWRATRSADDSDRGWGREESSSNDERLRREKPPHW
ncbi:hypothetical protein [Cellulomonas xiejunii]|uniref:Uncharacterized protein n=1 Tax=Cellulomonas xiejunii TaxID=2968083 RepID=A0ABY5KSD7_9CELL|nr:hypothetical protein [Cellulomonas xiejunii]MCC2322652.1 hypothetical protein [Cellulomonas xiejunii]UUI72690.1 hypothetical protein NP048_04330 [Cellulomonas xiejunii]